MVKKSFFQSKQVLFSVLLFFAASTAITFGDYYSAKKTVLEQSETHAERVARYLSSILVGDGNEEHLSAYHISTEHDQEIRDILASFSVVNVKIFDNFSRIIFSLEKEVVGKRVLDNAGLKSALTGRHKSHVANLGYLFRTYGEHEPFPMMETYVPIRSAPEGKVLGVYEIYQDYRPLKSYVNFETARSSVTHIILLVIFAALIFRFGRLASRMLEDQHLALIKELEVRVDERTSELKLSESKVKNLLERTEEMYRKLKIGDEYKKNLMNLVGHELRTPLTVIKGFLSLLADGTLESKQDQGATAVAKSMEETKNLENTIENIIELSQLEEGIGEVVRDDFDVRSLLEDAISNLEEERTKAGIKITVDVSNGISTFSSDRMKVHQVINQLLSNAIKFSPHGGNVSLSAVNGKHSLTLAVRDEGIGIPAEQQEDIFVSFYQVDISSTRNYEGSGLGLAIVKELVDVLDGKVWVKSEEGVGSTFFVEIPSLGT